MARRRTIHTLTGIGGTVYAAVAFAAIGLSMGVRTMSDDTYRHEVFPGIIHAADDASYVIHATGGAGIAAMVIAASIALTRAGVLPDGRCGQASSSGSPRSPRCSS